MFVDLGLTPGRPLAGSCSWLLFKLCHSLFPVVHLLQWQDPPEDPTPCLTDRPCLSFRCLPGQGCPAGPSILGEWNLLSCPCSRFFLLLLSACLSVLNSGTSATVRGSHESPPSSVSKA